MQNPVTMLDGSGNTLSFTGGAMAVAEVSPGTPVWASTTGAGSGALTATLPAVAGKTTYLRSINISASSVVANTLTTLTTTGLSANFTFQIETPVNGAVINIPFPFGIPASAANTPIGVSTSATTGGPTFSINVVGFQL